MFPLKGHLSFSAFHLSPPPFPQNRLIVTHNLPCPYYLQGQSIIKQYSSSKLISMNIPYMPIIIQASFLVRTHPQARIVTMTNPTMTKSMRTIMLSPSLLMSTWSIPATVVARNHGTGRPMRMSKTLEPMELLTAMSPWPFLATAREDRASGTEVPAAKRVRPMTGSGIPIIKPITVAIQTMKKARMAIHTMDMKNVTQNQ
mmetsp:Transcript_9460/g.19223  ORF Transcript_9460/g.19223 Transcript_9460/m.19223 type:complete len:201 (+) Transcript_9460:37-639(+)